MMGRVGIWRAIAGLALAASIALAVLGALQGLMLVVLIGAAITMIVMAERIHQLERETVGDAEYQEDAEEDVWKASASSDRQSTCTFGTALTQAVPPPEYPA